MRIQQISSELRVSWDRVHQPSAVGYRLYRRAENESAAVLSPRVIPVTAPEYRDTTAKRAITYYYSVACVDNLGREGSRSAEVAFVIQ